ncbi:MAG TPA: sigma-54 dependent transcriptional regulator [Bryobacteraceae bacterium]|nr:sigma-54 dependent transcriptional regulator [Bryobacteraceae bacterium]
MEAKRVLWICDSSSPSSLPVEASLEGWVPEFRPASPGLDELNRSTFDAVVLDFPIPGWEPAALLVEVLRLAPGTSVLIRDPGAGLSDAARLTRLGADQFFVEDYEVNVLLEQAYHGRQSRQLARLAGQVGREEWERVCVGNSRQMRQISHIIGMIGSRRSTVLITGETGTGKEMVARALHLAGPRRHARMVAINCSALPENLLEAELFGHVKGAFTGAVQNRIGRFEQAQGGTIFLDEIGDMPLDLQAKLLRVLQEREFQRLGSSESIRADVRVVAATNCDLLERIEQRKFREDLYYRLNVVPIHMPPLRERVDDIPLLAAHFVQKVCGIEEIPLKTLTSQALDLLCAYSWPGNVRQLENSVEMAVALSGNRMALGPGDFPLPSPGRARMADRFSAPVVSVPDDGLDYEQTVAGIERSILEQALRKTGGNKKAAAEMLRLKRTTLSAKVRTLAAVAG